MGEIGQRKRKACRGEIMERKEGIKDGHLRIECAAALSRSEGRRLGTVISTKILEELTLACLFCGFNFFLA